MARVTMLGRLVDVAGWRTKIVDADTVSGIMTALATDAPALANALQADTLVVIVNDVVTRSDAAIGPADEIGIMPPMSGG